MSGTQQEAKRGPGQPQFEPTRAQRQLVQLLWAHGFSQEKIAARIFHQRDLDRDGIAREGAKPISLDTLRKHFRAELDQAKDNLKSAMIANIVRAANNGQWGAAKYWLATQGGPEWREHHVVGGDPDAPIRVSLETMSEAELVRELDELRSGAGTADRARALAQAVPKRSNGVGNGGSEPV